MATRTPEEIRQSIVQARHELAGSVEELRSRVRVMTDWRRQLNEHRTAAIVATAAVGFLVGRRLLRRRRGD
jgi:transposase-like protein